MTSVVNPTFISVFSSPFRETLHRYCSILCYILLCNQPQFSCPNVLILLSYRLFIPYFRKLPSYPISCGAIGIRLSIQTCSAYIFTFFYESVPYSWRLIFIHPLRSTVNRALRNLCSYLGIILLIFSIKLHRFYGI